jgi:GNAT superfamily N-acetyltransferase
MKLESMLSDVGAYVKTLRGANHFQQPLSKGPFLGAIKADPSIVEMAVKSFAQEGRALDPGYFADIEHNERLPPGAEFWYGLITWKELDTSRNAIPLPLPQNRTSTPLTDQYLWDLKFFGAFHQSQYCNPVGLVTVLQQKIDLGGKEYKVGVIDLFAVHPDHKSNGIGKSQLQLATEITDKDRLPYILRTSSERANALYGKHSNMKHVVPSGKEGVPDYTAHGFGFSDRALFEKTAGIICAYPSKMR